MAEEYGEYLYEYYHDGAWWSFTLHATSFEDAEARLIQLRHARLNGRVEMTIPAGPGAGLLARAFCGLRNWLAEIRRTLWPSEQIY